MAKTVTSAKRKKFSRDSLTKHDAFGAHLKDAHLIKEVLVEALMNNDPETFQDVLTAHLRTVSKSRFSSKTKIGRQTLYDLIDEKKEFNPTFSTLGSILKGIAA